MYINVKVITKSKIEIIKEVKPLYFKVKTLKPPVKGDANKDIIRILSEYFNVKKNDIKILNGHKSSEKLIKIKDIDKKYKNT